MTLWFPKVRAGGIGGRRVGAWIDGLYSWAGGHSGLWSVVSTLISVVPYINIYLDYIAGAARLTAVKRPRSGRRRCLATHPTTLRDTRHKARYSQSLISYRYSGSSSVLLAQLHRLLCKHFC